MSIPLPYCVYVLFSEFDGNLYVGFSTDHTDRLTAHDTGNIPSTAPRRPFRLIFCEYYACRADAVRREKYLKLAAGKRALKLMLPATLASLRR